MKYFAIILILLSTNLSAQDTIKQHNSSGVIYKVGTLINGKKNGLWKTYNKEGVLFDIQKYKNDIKHGEWIDYLSSKIYEKGHYKNGKRNGIFRNYYLSPYTICSVKRYSEGILRDTLRTFYSNGKGFSILIVDSGEYLEFNLDGSTKTKGSYLTPFKEYNDSFENSNCSFTLNGIKAFKYGLKGKTGNWITYSPEDKKPTYEGLYKNGALTSWKSYHENGTLKVYFKYFSGRTSLFSCEESYPLIDGEFETYHPNGKLESKGQYKGKKLDGILINRYDNNRLKSKYLYKNGKLMEYLYRGLRNGEKLKIGEFKNGNGEIYRYDNNGKIVEKLIFKEGEQIKQ